MNKTEHIPARKREDCVFCRILDEGDRQLLASNEFAVAFYDNFPVTKGHVLIVPRRHFADLFDAEPHEVQAIFDLMKICRHRLIESYQPEGFNVGINIGKTAGQSIFHLHVHLIPRYGGDVSNPHGGVRHVIPGKGYY